MLQQLKKVNIFKHLIISNLITLILLIISLGFNLYSNQIFLLKKQIIQSRGNLVASNFFQQKEENIDIVDRIFFNHLQFDGYHYYQNAYQYQNNFVFMKGYTFFVQSIKFSVENILKNILNLQQSTQNKTDWKLTSTYSEIFFLVLFNKIFFVFSAFKLNKILQKISKSKADLGILLYIYNPGFIFFNSIYSQSLFCFIVFQAIDTYLTSRQKKDYDYIPLKTIVLLMFSISIRSNGVFLIIIVGLPLLFQFFNCLKSQLYNKLIKTFLYGLLMMFLFSLPILLYSIFIYLKLCKVQGNLTQNQSLAYECQKLFPNLYSYVQNKYWNVGFLKYYTINNMVFILIGFPSLIISSMSFYQLFEDIKTKNYLKRKTHQNITMAGFYLSFWILLTVSIFFANVQSATRFLCSHPIFYICLSSIMKKTIKIWIIIYYSIGTILFFLGFPWT